MWILLAKYRISYEFVSEGAWLEETFKLGLEGRAGESQMGRKVKMALACIGGRAAGSQQ